MFFRNLIKLYFVAITLSILSCKTDQNNSSKKAITKERYEILGTLKGISDSTWIFINKDNKKVDSTQVFNEEFSFTGKVDEPSSFFMIAGKTNPEYFFLWAENQKIEIQGKKGDIKNVKINAGQTQQESEILAKKNNQLNILLDQVQKHFRNTNLDKNTRDSLIQKQNHYLDKMQENSKQFIKDFPDSYVSSHILNINSTTWKKDTVNNLYQSLSDKIKSSKNGSLVKHFLSLPETPKIGDKYLDFELPDVKDNLVKLSSIKGKYVLVEFWASWCGPCREENPELVKTYTEFNNKGFEILGVSLDISKKNWVDAIEKDGLPWTNISELKGVKGDVSRIYGVNGIPYNFLIDERGIIIEENLRGIKLKEKLDQLFK